MSNRVVHFEIPCNQPENTIRFFQEVFGWTFQQFGGEEYWMAFTGDPQSPGINGAIMKKRDPDQPVVNTLDVANIEAILERITNAGGTVVVPKMPIPGVGWLAYFKDPDGNIHGVHQTDTEAR
ncbi:MAG: VOC family protein [Bacteroidetes bacterium]|nr:VOC family protein [Bacteroidota bacterium]